MLIDTGCAGGFDLPADFRQDVPPNTKIQPFTTNTFSNSVTENYYHVPATLYVGDAGRATMDTITISSDSRGLLGQAILSKVTIALDGPKQKVKFIPQQSAYDQPAATRPAASQP